MATYIHRDNNTHKEYNMIWTPELRVMAYKQQMQGEINALKAQLKQKEEEYNKTIFYIRKLANSDTSEKEVKDKE